MNTLSDPTAGWILGLDIGSSSIGWMLLREQPIPGSINAIGGVRVFPAATANEKDVEKSKTAIRRTARGMRRQHRRKSWRKRNLVHVLRKAGLLPTDTLRWHELLQLDPYALRADGLDRQLEPEEFGRALVHLNQRRGFKSNRRTDRTADDKGKVKAAIAHLREQIHAANSRTVGEYLHRNVPALVERRRGRYLHREMIREEFNLLWEKQSAGREAVFTPELRAKVEHAIFHQRPFDQGDHKVGFCEFEPGEKRCRIGHRQFQRFRILQEIANLRLIEPGKDERALTVEERRTLAAELDRKNEVKFERLPELLGLNPQTHFNLTRGKRERLDGNKAEVALRKVFGKAWDKLSEDERDARNEAALELQDDDLTDLARTQWGLDDEQIESLLKAPLNDKHGRVSLKAIKKLIPYLEELEPGETLHHAAEKAGYGDRRQGGEDFDKLPYPPGVRFNEKVEPDLLAKRLFVPNQTEITNPVVRKALFEVRKVVNAIIAKYGKPREIRVELARDTKGSIEERNKATSENAKNRQERERIRALLVEKGLTNPGRDDILKYRLWQECNETCPYSGKPISFEQLFISPEVQIEHILPYSQTLDDSYANKTLCFDDVNREKNGRSPFAAFGHQEERYAEMIQRVERFRGPFRYKKVERFKRKTLDIDGCVARQLNDTRFINRQVVSYLRLLGVPVRCSRGQVTAELRYCWGLNTILSPDGSNEKNRADHRHHAIDAAVIAMTTDGNIRNLARREQFKKDREAFPEPWPGFRNEIKDAIARINVSHRPTRRVRGALHEETNYGPTGKSRHLCLPQAAGSTDRPHGGLHPGCHNPETDRGAAAPAWH